MEEVLRAQGRRHARTGLKPSSRLTEICAALDGLLRISRLHALVSGRAGRFVIERPVFAFPDLPAAFDGYTILHLSDLHVGNVPGLMAEAGRRLAEESVDLVVLTGDIQTHGQPAPVEAARRLADLLAPLKPRDGVVAVLGNHDSHALVPPLEQRDVRVLTNQRLSIARGADHLHLIGLDDPHAFHTHAAEALLGERPEGFSVALVHTPDLADVAARAGHRLYLCGHTHGGQICLPGGRPLFTALDCHRHLASGPWRLDGLQGYTSRALGSSRPPLRINCPAEAAVIRLSRTPGFP